MHAQRCQYTLLNIILTQATVSKLALVSGLL